MELEKRTDIISSDEDVNDSTTDGPILVAVDLDSASEKPILWACKYAQYVGSEVLILHVVHERATAPGFYKKNGFSDNILEPIDNIAKRMVASLLDKMRIAHPDLLPLHDAETNLVTGLSGGRIVEIAKAKKVQLIVVGHRKRTGLSKFFEGSIAEHVMRNVTVPIVVINEQSGEFEDKSVSLA